MGISNISIFNNKCLIGGSWINGEKGNVIHVHNPADNSLLTTVPKLFAADAERAIVAANEAFLEWKQTTPQQRSNTLLAWYNLVIEHADELAKIMCLEQGKPLAEAKGEILYAASFIQWFAEEAKRSYGDTIPSSDSMRLQVYKEPVGVCVAITPWNFPAAMITRKVAPALAAGCTIIVKPATETPLTALALARLAVDAGIPDGVLNVVTGPASELAAVFTTSEVVRKISFTGSTAVGAKLMQACGATVKKVSMELGGNAPVIVFDDADLEIAVQGVINSKFRNAGQTCVCANRIYVQAGIHDRFVEALKEKVSQLKVGNGLDASTDIGPLINTKAVSKVQEHIYDALEKGASLVLGDGQPHTLGDNWMSPTIIKDVTQNMLCAVEETFGPLAPIFKFEDESEAVEKANSTEFGLAAYVFSQDVSRLYRVIAEIEAGMVGVNTGLISNEVSPFGGVKASGVGREGSKYGLDEYMELKYVCFGNIK